MMMVPQPGTSDRLRECNPDTQFAPGGRVPLQVSVSVKSIPEARMKRVRTVESLVLVRVAVLG
jgi:hypothetical protein